jgi:tetratricopeptide (TPR) repeat protein
MSEVTKNQNFLVPSLADADLGERLRRLRREAGLTQSELADGRFSKEYVSQIERGKTRPTPETLGWLAERLSVDPALLEHGVSADERGRIEATLARGEALVETSSYGEAVDQFRTARSLLEASPVPELELRGMIGEALALMRTSRVEEALPLLEAARELSEGPRFSDLDRADVFFRLGVFRYKRKSAQTAISLLTEALELAEGSGLPCDRLRVEIFDWRARCYRLRRDWEAAREDVERALELAEAIDDPRAAANSYFQASLIAERNGHWVLARTYAERAKERYEELADRHNVGRLLNNLGGLNFLLGNPKDAVQLLKGAFGVALEVDSDIDAAYAVSSLARVHLETGEAALAEEQARKALELLQENQDFLDEIGNAQLVLGRALLEQDRLDEADQALTAAQQSFEKLGSAGHRSAGLLARGQLAEHRGDHAEAARLYKNAAELLQDVRF